MKNFLVVGGSSGIGNNIALKLAEAGQVFGVDGGMSTLR